ncbi:hypothetical protein ACFRQM_50045 [Streptomyces sp. NPDC056831]|uniref:hypothetical protein n=1 Tax=Streptomyces sp. NPDC056831 TaxID=3345954 RepID=UPI0036862E7E
MGAFGQAVGVQPLLPLLLQLQPPEFGFGFGFGGELVLDDGVGLRVVRPAGRGKQLRDALPLSDFGGAAFVVGQVLAVAGGNVVGPTMTARSALSSIRAGGQAGRW